MQTALSITGESLQGLGRGDADFVGEIEFRTVSSKTSQEWSEFFYISIEFQSAWNHGLLD